MTFGDIKTFLDKIGLEISEFLNRLFLTFSGEIPMKEVQVFDAIAIVFLVVVIIGLIVGFVLKLFTFSTVSIKYSVNNFHKLFIYQTYKDIFIFCIFSFFSLLGFILVYPLGYLCGLLQAMFLIIYLDNDNITKMYLLYTLWALSAFYAVAVYFLHKSIYSFISNVVPNSLLSLIYKRKNKI